MPHTDGFAFAMMALMLLLLHVTMLRAFVPLWAQWLLRSLSTALVALMIIIIGVYIWFLKSL